LIHSGACSPKSPDDTRSYSDEEIDNLLKKDVGKFEDEVINNTDVKLNQGQFDALVSLGFNLKGGYSTKSTGTMIRTVNKGDMRKAEEAFSIYSGAGGSKSRGLVKRRGDEAELFGTGKFNL
jgi:lysozyme